MTRCAIAGCDKPPMAGEEMCSDCTDDTMSSYGNATDDDFYNIARLEDEGHTPHCARRIVWGDGGCECGKAKVMPQRDHMQTALACLAGHDLDEVDVWRRAGMLSAQVARFKGQYWNRATREWSVDALDAMSPEVAADTICTELGAIISKLPKRGE